MSIEQQDNSPLPLETYLYGCWYSQAIITLHRLGIPSYLQQQGAQNLANIATAIGADSKVLWQLLTVAKGLGIVELDAQGNYELSNQGKRLCPESDDSLIPSLDHLQDGYAAWGELADSIKTGKAAFNKVYGKNIYDYLSEHPEKNAYFNRYMEQTTAAWLAEVGKYYQFTGHLIDLGGNKGALTAMLLKQFPNLQATLFDLKQTTWEAPPILEAAGVTARCHIVAGSFFEVDSIPKNGDIYLFSRVLLNWNDEEVINILQNCRQAMPKQAKLLLLDFVITEDINVESCLGSLNLLVMFGSRTRTQKEFENLFKTAGFGAFNWIDTGNNLFFLEANPI